MLSMLNPPLDILYLKERIQSENRRYNYSLFKRRKKIIDQILTKLTWVGVPRLNKCCLLFTNYMTTGKLIKIYVHSFSH